jgi:hypothetical protein
VWVSARVGGCHASKGGVCVRGGELPQALLLKPMLVLLVLLLLVLPACLLHAAGLAGQARVSC